jgi:hypothetical protein
MLATLAAGTLFVVARLASYGWDPSGFVYAGDRFVDPAKAPPGLTVRRNAIGFDGTGFYRLALNPFTRRVEDHGIVLDLPSFRHQRILYPILVWAASGGGRPAAVPWALIGVNLACFAAVGWLGAAVAGALGRAPAWGLAFGLYPGFALSLGLDTAEVVAAALALGGILALVRRRPALAAAAFVAAMFARETTLLVPIGVGLAWLAARLRRAPAPGPAYLFALPGAAYVAWQAFLTRWWGHVPLARGGAIDLAAPMVGLVGAAPGWVETAPALAAFHFLLVAGLLAFGLWVARSLRSSAAPAFARWGAAAGLVLALLWSDDIWLHHWGFLRAFTETYLLGVVTLLGAGSPRLYRLAAGVGGLWMAICINVLLHP